MELKRKIISRESETENPNRESQGSGQGNPGGDRDQLINSVMQSLGGGNAKIPDRPDDETEEHDEKKAPASKKPLRKKLLFIGVPALCLVLASAGLLVYRFASAKPAPGTPGQPKLEGMISIKRPIPVPDFREMLNFLVAADFQGQKMVTTFRLEIAFQNAGRYRNFKENNVVFRDTVYSYLLSQNMTRQTSKSWHDVLGRDLVEYIGAKLPQSRADSIRLTQIENF